MSTHESIPALSSYRNSTVHWSESEIHRATERLACLTPGHERRGEVLRVLEHLAAQLEESLPRERANYRCLQGLEAKSGYRLVMGPSEGLSCQTPIEQLGILPDGALITSSLGGFLLRWRREGPEGGWRSAVIYHGHDAAPRFDIDPTLGVVHTLDECKVVVGAPFGTLEWVCSPLAFVHDPIRSVEILGDGSVAIMGVRQLAIATRQRDGQWKTEEHGLLGNLRAAAVLPSGWVFIGEDNRTGVFHRDWPEGPARRKEIGRSGGHPLGEGISCLRILRDGSVAVGRRSGGVSIIKQGPDAEWRERLLLAAGAPVIALQAVATGGLVSLRANGEVSFWSQHEEYPPLAGGHSFSGAKPVEVWRESRLLRCDTICKALGSSEFFFTDGRMTAGGAIYLAGAVEAKGAVLVFDGEPCTADTDKQRIL